MQVCILGLHCSTHQANDMGAAARLRERREASWRRRGLADEVHWPTFEADSHGHGVDGHRARAALKGESRQASEEPPEGEASISLSQAASDILALRQRHSVAGCKYCGIPTLDLREDELESRPVALLRAAGLGVNSASFTDFEPGERICTECAAHEVECDLCGRQMDSFLDGGVYRRANADEAYVCTRCAGRLDDSLERDRDW